MMLAPNLSPGGTLSLQEASEGTAVDPAFGARLTAAFAKGAGHGLLCLGADALEASLPPALAFWRAFGTRYVTAFCAAGTWEDDSAQRPGVPVPGDDDLERLVLAAPPMAGTDYLTREVLGRLWRDVETAFVAEKAASGLTTQAFLKTRNPAWSLVGRVHFNLAENRKDEEAPFAFLATFATGLSAQAKTQHLPLGKALTDTSGAHPRERLLALLVPVLKAAEACPWLRGMVDRGEIYHPLRWSPAEAVAFLRDVPALERAGIVVRMPASWRMHRPSRPMVKATVGGAAPTQFGLDAILDFQMDVTLDGETLSPDEVRQLLGAHEELALIRGRWVEVDQARLKRTLDQFEAIAQRAASDGLPFGEAMRLLAGAGRAADAAVAEEAAAWSVTVAGPWLAATLSALRAPGAGAAADPGAALRATLRPYQRAGVQWLHLLSSLRLGACLADDMGLGKTIQVVALLLVLRGKDRLRDRRDGQAAETDEPLPSLLVAPASLLANWAAEVARFAPSLTARILHPSAPSGESLRMAQDLRGVDLVITSYGFLARTDWLVAASWRLAVLDEAQAIKNPGAKQTLTVKRLRAASRIALTGTPIENRLGDLWSIFDFINPGLLGSARRFSTFVKELADRPEASYAPLRTLVQPYILRRLKTDRSIIDDLPDKIEVKAYCPLSRMQAALYAQAVAEIAARLRESDGIERKGLVLALLMRLKQICNHPSQWLGDGAWAEADSGKLGRLREIADVIAAKQEKVLVFTQFKETTAPLAAFLETIFGRPGLVLHGGTDVRLRKDRVRAFQEDETIPFFVLSVKAGGAGLNLTAASHVVHFDRWWNPAVENQATDRAFRIGQTRTVLVQKFICQGTVEDKIDRMIEAKHALAGDFLSGGAETALTEMKTEELLDLVRLDLGAAMQER